jgi:uncharacterized membrane protein YgcG
VSAPRARFVGFVVLGACLALGAGPPIPAPSGFITDRAGVINAQRRDQIIRLLNELGRRTGAEVAVLTVQSTQPLDDREYARRVFRRWRIGKDGRENGLLILLAVRDRRVEIIPGRGAQRILPPAKIDAIIEGRIVPEFKQGHYGLGILEGAWAIAREIAAAAHVKLRFSPPREESAGTQARLRWKNNARALIVAGVLLLLALWKVPWAEMARLGKMKHRRSHLRSGGGLGRTGGGAFGVPGRSA